MKNNEDKPKKHPLLGKIMIFVVVCLLLVAAIYYLALQLQNAKEDARLAREAEKAAKLAAEEAAKAPKIDFEALEQRLESVAELTTAELYYQGIIRYQDGKIPYLTQKAFSMLYTAKVRAGVDASQITMRVTDTTVYVTIPNAVIQSVEVDPDSIQFYDNKAALLNWTKKEDAIDAVKAARMDVEANSDLMNELKTKANDELRALVSGFLEGQIGERTLQIF